MKFLLFAGGSGTKLWPLSRAGKPKQFQPVIGEKSLFRINVEMLLEGYSAKDLIVSTKRNYVKYIIEHAPEIPVDQIIIEPDIKKNSGPAMGYSLLKLQAKYPKEPFMVIQTDVLRRPNKKFLEMVATIEKLVISEKKLVTGGQKALIPDMGVDYFLLGDRIKVEAKMDIYELEKYVPRMKNYQRTEDLIKDFHVATHVNHYCWYPDLMLKACEKHRPDWYRSLMAIKKVIGKDNEYQETERIYSEMKAGPFEDVTNKIFKDSYIILVPFQWIDFGTWDSVFHYLVNNNEVYIDGNAINAKTQNTLIKGKKEKLIVTLGIKNLIIVDTQDALLVMAKNNSGEMKDILVKMQSQKHKKYL